ncbi:class IIb bacteriocin, lactobin A/cerein 7B family [Glaciecola siphonariae]|uniref:Class IIb bacteriocin, lactobin A/cerein 7B family n=1 Tax=Glaciecola siphonariae TaxID=521012 RepID=A0ABV9LZ57_9ALTE
MTELQINQTSEVSGRVPLFLAIAVYGELAVFAATFSGIATYNTLK